MFPRTLARCCQFGALRLVDAGTLQVRRRLPPADPRGRSPALPDSLQAEHARWVDAPPAAIADDMRLTGPVAWRCRSSSWARTAPAPSASSHRWRFHPALASEATAWALDRHVSAPDDTAA